MIDTFFPHPNVRNLKFAVWEAIFGEGETFLRNLFGLDTTRNISGSTETLLVLLGIPSCHRLPEFIIYRSSKKYGMKFSQKNPFSRYSYTKFCDFEAIFFVEKHKL